jgi:hypothetical protein
MTFKPHHKSWALNLTGATQAAICSRRRDSRHASAFSRHGLLSWMLLFSAALLLTFTATAQSTQAGASSSPSIAAPGTTHTQRHVVHHRKRHAHAKVVAPVIVTPPPPPPPPVPPVEQAARPAKVEFSRGNLRIDAVNSSLIQIFNQISRQTGLVVEGLNRDERIYGQYGPGSVASVLTKLLDGAGYDYVIVGGGEDRPPSKLILTPGSNTAGAGTVNPMAATNSAPVASPVEPSAPANPSEPPQPKTPQEIFNELRGMHSHQHPQPQ